MRFESQARCRGIEYRQHESNWSLFAVGNDLTLLLSRSKLPLEVHQAALDLDLREFERVAEQEIRRTQVSRRHDMLDLRHPYGVGKRDDPLGDLQLPRVSKADAGLRMEAPAKLHPARCSELAANRQAYRGAAVLGGTHFLLTDASAACKLSLG